MRAILGAIVIGLLSVRFTAAEAYFSEPQFVRIDYGSDFIPEARHGFGMVLSSSIDFVRKGGLVKIGIALDAVSDAPDDKEPKSTTGVLGCCCFNQRCCYIEVLVVLRKRFISKHEMAGTKARHSFSCSAEFKFFEGAVIADKGEWVDFIKQVDVESWATPNVFEVKSDVGSTVSFQNGDRSVEIWNDRNPRSKACDGGVCLPTGFLSRFPRFVQSAHAEQHGSNSTDSGNKRENSRQPPIEPLFAMMFALFGVPAFLYGLWRAHWVGYLGFASGSFGIGALLADWLGWNALPFVY